MIWMETAKDFIQAPSVGVGIESTPGGHWVLQGGKITGPFSSVAAAKTFVNEQTMRETE